jgi:hypothetical protein
MTRADGVCQTALFLNTLFNVIAYFPSFGLHAVADRLCNHLAGKIFFVNRKGPCAYFRYSIGPERLTVTRLITNNNGYV